MDIKNHTNSLVLRNEDISKAGNMAFSNIKKDFNELNLRVVDLLKDNNPPEMELLLTTDAFGEFTYNSKKKQTASNKSRPSNIKPIHINDKLKNILETLMAKDLSFTKKGLSFSNELTLSLPNDQAYYLLFDKLLRVNNFLRTNFSNIIELLISLIELKDRYTLSHSINVRNTSTLIAKQLQLGEKDINEICYAAALHDIGKITIPESILNKPSKLTIEEFKEIKKHPIQGASLLASIKNLKNVSKIIMHHHERYDGNGYPIGLSALKIPIGSRIIAVADAYEAMTSKRPYREKMSKIDAINIIKNESGSQFDPEVVEAFLDIMFKIPKKGILNPCDNSNLSQNKVIYNR
jgi:putative nucleotidyltransferase with HDIG domain